MSIEVVIQSMGGDEAMVAKSLVIAIMWITQNWYTTLEAWSIFSWEQLKEALLENFY